MRRVLKASADGAEVERYAYEGANRVAVIDRFGTVTESTLFDGVDHLLDREIASAGHHGRAHRRVADPIALALDRRPALFADRPGHARPTR